MTTPKGLEGPLVLVILDGWGLDDPSPGNAVELAETPRFDWLWHEYPHTTLRTSGVDVGLREGQIGNSEVGHLNIGAGFVVNQAIRQIDVEIETGTFFENPALLAAVHKAKAAGRPLHVMGLVSDGGVHSHIDHLFALLDLAARNDHHDVAIHAFLDGRDTSPTAGSEYVASVQRATKRYGAGRVASVVGRYFAMDRDKRWDRTRKAFDLLVHGIGEVVGDPVAAIQRHYAGGNTDEFMEPLVVTGASGHPVTIQSGDSVIFFNFRADRARQITQALYGPDVDGADFSDRPNDLTFVGLMPYADFLDIRYAFEPVSVEYPLARVVSEAGLRQFHTAETEKYAHVTYFINGGRESPFEGEERVLIPSPKVATYDLQPEMSAPAVGDATVEAIRSGDYDLIIVNFANPDMVGHTGIIQAAVRACETVDLQLGRVVDAALDARGVVFVFADHGNAEQMLVPGTNEPMTAHTTNPVPFILVAPEDSPWRHSQLRHGRLADVAPTALAVLNLKPPAAMTGDVLIA